MADRMGLLLTVEGFAEYKRAAGGVKRLNDGVAQSMQDVEQTSGPAQVSVKKLATAFAVGGTAAALFMKGLNVAVGGAKKLIIGSTMLAARVDVLGTVLQRVGGNAGFSATELAKLEADVKSMGITTRAARQSLIMMAQANVDLAYATDLSRVAQDAAVIAGINSSQAFERLVYAMSRGRTYIMRTMGIMTNFVKAETELADRLGKTRKELTENERMQARYQEVMRAASVIQGAYTEAMEKAGKQMTSIPRYLEEIQLALGEAFQPVFTTIIFELKERLGELLEFLKDPATKKALDDFGEALDKALKLMLIVADEATGEMPKVIQLLERTAVAVSDIVWPLEVAQQTVDNLGASFRQFASMFWAFTVATVEGVKVLLGELVDLGEAIAHFGAVTYAVWTGQPELIEDAVEGLRAAVVEMDWDLVRAEEAVNRAFEEALISAGQFFEVIESGEDSLRDWNVELERSRRAAQAARDAVEELGDATVELSDDMVKASEALVNLRLRLQREYADRLIQQERDTIKREIQLAREREAIARRNAEAVADAYRRAEEARGDLAEDAAERWADFERDAAKERKEIDLDYARTRVDIERDTRRRLEDIQRDFEFALMDAARTRDAFALVMAQRRAAKEREEALRGRDRQLADAKTDYERQRDDLRRSLAQQRADLQRSLDRRQQDIERQLQAALVAAERQRQEDLASLARRDAREREMAALQAQWEEQDRRTRLARQLEDMERQYGVLLNVTAEGLLKQIQEWAEAYGPEGAATRIVRTFADMAEKEAERVRLATVEMANEWLDAMRMMSRVSPVGIPLPPEFQFQSPKLGLEVGFRSLEKYLKSQPLNIMPQGAMPATRSSTFSRTESLQRTESLHNVDVNMPNVDAVVQRQMLGIFRQVLAA